MGTVYSNLRTYSMTRGDTKGYKFQRKDKTGAVILGNPDAMYVTIKTDWKTPRILIQIPLEEMTQSEDGYWHFHFEPTDTGPLPYGTYCGDVEVHKNEAIFTISKFYLKLTDEATWSSGEREF